MVIEVLTKSYLCLVGNEGMIHWLTIHNNPSNPQQPIHSLRLAPVRICSIISETLGFSLKNGLVGIICMKHLSLSSPSQVKGGQ